MWHLSHPHMSDSWTQCLPESLTLYCNCLGGQLPDPIQKKVLRSLLTNFDYIMVLPKYLWYLSVYCECVESLWSTAMLHSLNWCIPLKSCSLHDHLWTIRNIYHCLHQDVYIIKTFEFFEGCFLSEENLFDSLGWLAHFLSRHSTYCKWL